MSRILVISDIHGNKYALEEVMRKVSNWDFLIFLGDVTDYGPHVKEVLERIKESADYWVRGNHDNAVAFQVDCQCGEKTHELSVFTREEISLKQLDKKDIDFLKTLPVTKKIEIDGLIFFFVHASPKNQLYGYLYPWLKKEEFNGLLETPLGLMTTEGTNYLLVGHTHVQFKKKTDKFIIVNPGSVGQPRDGHPTAAYAVIDTNKETITLRRTKYPLEKTVTDLKKLLLPRKELEEKLIAIIKEGSVS